MKHSLQSLALLTLFTVTYGTGFAAFSDVSTSYSYKGAIEWAESRGIVSGYADGTFRPHASINRAEFVKIVVGANFTAPAITLCDPNHIYSFSDASRTEWYSKHLCIAVQHTIISGYPDGTFRPDYPINVVEASKIIAIASQLRNGVATAESRTFTRSAGQEWFEPYMDYLKERNVLPPSIRRNDQLLTRGEMAEMMYRLSDSFHAPASEQGDMKTYEDIHGIFTMQLPSTWRAMHLYGASYIAFEKLVDEVVGYGDPGGGSEIVLEVWRRVDVTLQPGKTLLTFVTERYGPTGGYSLRTRQESGYKVHDLILTDPKPEYKILAYTLFERDDAIVAFGYGIPSTTTTAIQASFKFIPKNAMR